MSNVAALQDYAKEQQFRKLNAEVKDVKVMVVRDGNNVSIPKVDLVVGDVVRLSIGKSLCLCKLKWCFCLVPSVSRLRIVSLS